MSSTDIVNADLPFAGLGNMLLVWARAAIFAELNHLPMVAPMWNSIHIGPWLRKERCKRYYGNFFSTRHYTPLWQYFIGKSLKKSSIHANPPIAKLDLGAEEVFKHQRNIFLFDRMPPWNDYFQDLKDYQVLVKEKLYRDIHQNLLAEILQKPTPKIGIHIRRGDYQSPQEGDDFVTRRAVYTKLEWYIDVLSAIRAEVGENIPATVFSDGYPEELEDILALPDVSLSTETSALSDLITMSRSGLLIASSHSSFSAWASYLGQCPTIWQPERYHLYEPIFTKELRERIYEGGFDPRSTGGMPDLLKQNLLGLTN
jgi:hypothetical protein